MGRTAAAATVGLVVLAAVLAAAATSARALPPEILRSVVAVLPDRPGSRSPAAGREGMPRDPEGSAVAVFPGGYLATNAHVIGAAQRVKVRLDDGRLLPAEVVGRDPPTDLALLKIGLDLPVPPVAAEPALAARVCAVGNQFGLGISVSCGVVSAVRRTGTGFNPFEDFIQTDAAVNPGGSGGALVDEQGRLVGIVSAIFTKQSDANIGINFASSMRLVLRVVEDLKAHGRVIRGGAGLTVENLDDEALATQAGARVVRVDAGGAATRAGLEPGDVIVRLADRPVLKASDVSGAIALFRPGERLAVEYVRSGVPAGALLVLQP